MSPLSLVYPMAAMVLLTMFVLVRLFRARVGAVRGGRVDASYYRLYQGAGEPEEAQKLSRHFINLFESPTLFYVACLAAMIAGVTGWAMVALAWAYVMARILHAVIHLGGNRVRKRLTIYFAGWLILAVMWITLAVTVALRG
jgi:hypothetical protein